MEDRGRNNHRRPKNRKPPRGFWHPTVPAWEKEFCKEVGSIDWESLLKMKEFVHLYDKITAWNDSAGEEAFLNSKKRYWAKKNGLSCDASLPDPDLYIDQVNWDSDIDLDRDHDRALLSDVETLPMSHRIEEDHDSVVIFGDLSTPNRDLATVGWGDGVDEEKFGGSPTCSSHNYADPWAYCSNEWAPAVWPVFSNEGWQGYTNDGCQGYNNVSGHGYMPWEVDWSNWSYANNSWYNYVGLEIRDTWDENNVPMNGSGGCMSSYENLRARGNKHIRKHDNGPYERLSAIEWESELSSCWPELGSGVNVNFV